MYQKSLIGIISLITLFSISCSKKEASTPSNPTPSANFNYTISKPFAPTTVVFSNLSTYATDYRWDFGDNNNSLLISPTNLYTKGGTYTVRLTATGIGGSNSVTKTVNIPNPATRLQIDKITLGSLTNTPTGNFDFYFRVINSNNQEVWKSGNVKDFNSTKFPTTFTVSGSLILLNLALDFQVEVWRVGLFTDTRLGFAPLVPSLYNTGANAYPAYITIPNSLNGTGMLFDITWLQ